MNWHWPWHNLKTPAALTFEGWDEWRAQTKAAYPVPWFFQETLAGYWDSIRYRVRNLKNWIKHRWILRSHMLDLRTEDFRGGHYSDPRVKMFNACFNLLK